MNIPCPYNNYYQKQPMSSHRISTPTHNYLVEELPDKTVSITLFCLKTGKHYFLTVDETTYPKQCGSLANFIEIMKNTKGIKTVETTNETTTLKFNYENIITISFELIFTLFGEKEIANMEKKIQKYVSDNNKAICHMFNEKLFLKENYLSADDSVIRFTGKKTSTMTTETIYRKFNEIMLCDLITAPKMTWRLYAYFERLDIIDRVCSIELMKMKMNLNAKSYYVKKDFTQQIMDFVNEIDFDPKQTDEEIIQQIKTICDHYKKNMICEVSFVKFWIGSNLTHSLSSYSYILDSETNRTQFLQHVFNEFITTNEFKQLLEKAKKRNENPDKMFHVNIRVNLNMTIAPVIDETEFNKILDKLLEINPEFTYQTMKKIFPNKNCKNGFDMANCANVNVGAFVVNSIEAHNFKQAFADFTK